MKNKEIISTYEELTSLRAAGTTRFSARVSFAIIHNLRLLQPIVEDAQTSYREILSKYGKPTEQADQFVIDDIPAYNKEIKELEDLDIDIQLSKIKLSDIDHLELTVQEMDALYCMIEEEEGE